MRICFTLNCPWVKSPCMSVNLLSIYFITIILSCSFPITHVNFMSLVIVVRWSLFLNWQTLGSFVQFPDPHVFLAANNLSWLIQSPFPMVISFVIYKNFFLVIASFHDFYFGFCIQYGIYLVTLNVYLISMLITSMIYLVFVYH